MMYSTECFRIECPVRQSCSSSVYSCSCTCTCQNVINELTLLEYSNRTESKELNDIVIELEDYFGGNKLRRGTALKAADIIRKMIKDNEKYEHRCV